MTINGLDWLNWICPFATIKLGLKALIFLLSILMDYASDRHPWKRQENEPSRWFERFENYLKMGAGRSLLGLYNQEFKRKKDKIPGSWNSIVDEWEWEYRADQFDEHQRKEDWKKYYKTRKERMEELQESEWKTGKDLLEKAQKMLDFPICEEEISESGQIIRKPTRWGFRDLVAMISLASQLRKSSLGISDKKMDVLEAIYILMDAGIADPDQVRIIKESFEGLEDKLKNQN